MHDLYESQYSQPSVWIARPHSFMFAALHVSISIYNIGYSNSVHPSVPAQDKKRKKKKKKKKKKSLFVLCGG